MLNLIVFSRNSNKNNIYQFIKSLFKQVGRSYDSLFDSLFISIVINRTRLKNRYRNRSLPATRLFPLKVGEVMTFKQPRAVWGIPVYLGAVRTPSEHAIIIANTYTPTLVADYARRWEIETRGFDMECTRLRDPERLSKLAIAFAWCYRVGLWRARLKPIRRLKHSRPALTGFR